MARLRNRYERLRPRLEDLGVAHERFEGVDGLEILPEPSVISENLMSGAEFDVSTQGERLHFRRRDGDLNLGPLGLYLLSVAVRHTGPRDVAIRYYLSAGERTLRHGTAKPIEAARGWQHVSWELYKQRDEPIDSINFLVMGSEPDHTEIRGAELLQTDHRFVVSRGMIGCNLTHARAVRDAREKGHRRILCLEDDVYFHRSFTDRFATVVPEIPRDWRLLYLGAKQRARRWKDIEIHDPGWYRAVECNGLHAYGLDERLYDRFIETVERHEQPVDLAMHQFQESYPCYVLFPNLVIANERESATQEKSPEDARRIAEASRWDLTLYATE